MSVLVIISIKLTDSENIVQQKMIIRSILLLTFLTFYEVECVTCTFKYTSLGFWSYECVLIDQLVESESDLIHIDGDHGLDFSDGRVLKIESTNSTIYLFPSLLIEHFPNVTHATLHNAQMKSFDRPIRCGKLEYIGLDDNLLSNIPEDIFANCPKLTTLSLNGNNLGSIGEHDFAGLLQLSSLSLIRCNLTSIHPKAFSSLVRLAAIALNSNNLKTLDSELFKNCSRLSTVSISENRISELDEKFFNNNVDLYSVNISNNRITRVGEDIFSINFFVYGSIDLSNNLIEELPIFKSIAGLSNLNFNNNKIKNILPDTFKSLYDLYELKLGNNQIESLQSGAFNGYHKLSYLFLNSNNMTELQPNSFSRLSLYALWLSDNQLRHLNACSFTAMPFSYELHVERNLIESVDSGLLYVLPQLSLLNLTGNVCANESFIITVKDREQGKFLKFGTCSSDKMIPVNLIVFVLILFLTSVI